MKVLGIDIGGSSVKGAPVDLRTGQLLAERLRLETPEPLTPAAMGRKVAEIARHFKWHDRIGVGFPGVIRGTRTLTSANLHPRFVGCDAGALFARATGCRVALVNDADAAGLAEMKFGAGRGSRGVVLLVTVGTGVGSALFYRRVLFPNTEFGHLPIRGAFGGAFHLLGGAETARVELGGLGPRTREYLRTLEMLLSPELIILGGGVSAKGEKYFRFLKCRAPIVPASAYNAAGIVGAALWAAEQK